MDVDELENSETRCGKLSLCFAFHRVKNFFGKKSSRYNKGYIKTRYYNLKNIHLIVNNTHLDE